MFILYEMVLTADRVAAADLTMFYWIKIQGCEWPSIEQSLQSALSERYSPSKVLGKLYKIPATMNTFFLFQVIRIALKVVAINKVNKDNFLFIRMLLSAHCPSLIK